MFDLKSEEEFLTTNDDKELNLTFASMIANSDQKVEEVVEQNDTFNNEIESDNNEIELENDNNKSDSNEQESLMTKYNELIEQGYRPDNAEKIARSIVKQDEVEQNEKLKDSQVGSEISMKKTVDKEQSNEELITKLESMDRISTDLERRLSKEDNWMEANTANYFSKLEETEKRDEKPHKIIEIKKAGAKILEKAKEIEFVEKMKHVLEICKKNKDAIVFTTAFVGMAIVGGLINSNDTTVAPIIPDSTIETNTNTDLELDNTNLEITTDSVTVKVDNPTIEETESNTLEISEEKAKESILTGSQVYSNVVDANQETNGLLPTDQQLESSWNNSEVGAYYTLNDNGVQQLSNEEAKIAFNDGEQVIVRLDNENTPIGFVPLETSEKGISR